MDVAYEAPYYSDYKTTWIQGPVHITEKDKHFQARIIQTDGEVVELDVKL